MDKSNANPESLMGRTIKITLPDGKFIIANVVGIKEGKVKLQKGANFWGFYKSEMVDTAILYLSTFTAYIPPYGHARDTYSVQDTFTIHPLQQNGFLNTHIDKLWTKEDLASFEVMP